MSDNLLDIKNLSFSYDDKIVLDNIDISLQKGQFLLINGKNGSGKSTLLRLINKMEVVNTTNSANNNTKMCFDGEDYSNFNEKQMEKIRLDMPLIMQNRSESFYEKADLLASVIEVALLKKIDSKENLKKSAKNLAKVLGLNESIWYKHANILSGGEIGRLNFIRVLLMDSKLYLIDEGDAGLDDTNLEKLLAIINELLERGKSFIWVSHRQILLKNGKISKKIIKNSKLI